MSNIDQQGSSLGSFPTPTLFLSQLQSTFGLLTVCQALYGGRHWQISSLWRTPWSLFWTSVRSMALQKEPIYGTRPCCLVQAITRHTCPDPHLGSWNCLAHQAHIASSELLSSIDQQGSSLGSFSTSPSPLSPLQSAFGLLTLCQALSGYITSGLRATPGFKPLFFSTNRLSSRLNPTSSGRFTLFFFSWPWYALKVRSEGWSISDGPQQPVKVDGREANTKRTVRPAGLNHFDRFCSSVRLRSAKGTG